jgi:lipopolysaccharide export system protein LptC
MSGMTTADTYSRMVRWLKVALPLTALAILSTLFFVAETLDPDAAIPYADVDVERLLREQGITKPAFGAVTEDGVAISMSADSIRPGAEQRDRLTGTELTAKLTWPDAAQIDIESPEGIVDVSGNEAILKGGAVLKSSTGYTVRSDQIIARMNEASVYSPGSISAEGPIGSLAAGRMELTRQSNADNGYLLVFKDGVRLLYQPRP